MFFFNDTPTTEIYTLSLHDALPIWDGLIPRRVAERRAVAEVLRDRELGEAAEEEHLRDVDVLGRRVLPQVGDRLVRRRSEEHTSELQSRQYLVCRLLLEKKTTHQHR